MVAWLVLVTGGAVGAVCRYLQTLAVQHLASFDFPVGTLSVNLSGSLLIGVLAGLIQLDLLQGSEHGLLWLAFGVGFCGSYTTLSSWSLDTLRLGLEGRPWLAAINLVLTLLACLFCVTLGFLGGRALVG
ncbi:CrcB family protein [Gammaproteobacteria bacterium AB-CW1]|uniref:Fluoride-specific ion channel FluC n=1 Tax=Natronospira elongata TaxID=3110268 RepID=A0AAP6JCN6_9GAMM|nr:CrcB family protein [Gammaproteobacteria bacterium AB-CW1]